MRSGTICYYSPFRPSNITRLLLDIGETEVAPASPGRRADTEVGSLVDGRESPKIFVGQVDDRLVGNDARRRDGLGEDWRVVELLV